MQRTASITVSGNPIPVIKDLIIYREDGSKGVGSVVAEYDQLSIFTNSDPRSANYQEVLQGNLTPTSSLPSSGSFFAGQRIKNSNLSATISGNRFSEIVRLTTGTGNVFGTDWGLTVLTV